MEKCLLSGTLRAERKGVKKFELRWFWDQVLVSRTPLEVLRAQRAEPFCYFLLSGSLSRFRNPGKELCEAQRDLHEEAQCGMLPRRSWGQASGGRGAKVKEREG